MDRLEMLLELTKKSLEKLKLEFKDLYKEINYLAKLFKISDPEMSKKITTSTRLNNFQHSVSEPNNHDSLETKYNEIFNLIV